MLWENSSAAVVVAAVVVAKSVFKRCDAFTHFCTLFHFTFVSRMGPEMKMGSCPARHTKRNFDTRLFGFGKYSDKFKI